MPVDPQLHAFLAQMADEPPIDQVPLDVLRNTPFFPNMAKTVVKTVSNLTIATEAGDLPARLYRDADGVLPLLVFFHGGGFVLGDLDSYDALCRDLAALSGGAVLSVDYRLAPEHPFPAATDDALAAVRWAAAHAELLGIDPARIAVGGDSAGGNLAAVTALRVRDEGGPGLSGQMLIYPVTRYHTPPTRSMIEYGEGYLLTHAAMVWYLDTYLQDASRAHHPHFEIVSAGDLSRLPPAFVLTAAYDPLCDEGEEYADLLTAAGVAVERICYGGMVHGFFGMPGIDKSVEAIRVATAWLKRVLG